MDLKKECKKELTERILPFWNKLRDDENGGFYGYMDNDLKVDKKADKGVILNSRILWFYSMAYKILGEDYLLDNARHAYEFLRDKCVDRKNGGVYFLHAGIPYHHGLSCEYQQEPRAILLVYPPHSLAIYYYGDGILACLVGDACEGWAVRIECAGIG